jgi:DNA replication and repair protein RecF
LRIQRIHLTNFRNFADEWVEFGPRRNLILGSNAQGKTNLLEAIHILGVGRSHRDRKDANLVKFNEDFYRIEGVFDHIGVRTVIEVSNNAERKRLRLNGKDIKPAELIGLVGIVISSPDDINLIKGSPGLRRTFLDMAISQSSREYLGNLQHYVRALAQRNKLLKAYQESRVRAADATAWDRRLIEAGARVVRGRIKYLAEIAPEVGRNFDFIAGAGTPAGAADADSGKRSGVTGGTGQPEAAPESPPTESRRSVSLPYQPRGYTVDDGGNVEERLAAALEAHRKIEMIRGYSLYGPHVDDFRFLANGRDIRQFGSEGEQRTSVLALRCAEVSAMQRRTGRYPVVLLDDVFAELDEARSTALTALISGFDQILLTSSRLIPLPDDDIHQIIISEGKAGWNGAT